ncbi:hypothetical protein SprV_0602180200 [Sparganum proliferum]
MISATEGSVQHRRAVSGTASHPHVAYQPVSGPSNKWTIPLRSPVFYIYVSAFLAFIAVTLFFLLNVDKKFSKDALEFEKCPACFGQSFCPHFFRGDVRLPAFRSPALDLIDAYVGADYRKYGVKLRRLYYPAPSEIVDAAVCRRGPRFTSSPDKSPPLETMKKLKCIPHLSIWRWRPTSGAGTGEILHEGLLTAETSRANFTDPNLLGARERTLTGFSPLVRCASSRLLSLVQSRYRERAGSNAALRWLRFDELTLLFNLAINPHAVVIQTFPRSQGWPFSTHLGACGRLTVERAAGVPLAQFCSASAEKRLRVLRGLLTLPKQLDSSDTASDESNSRPDANFTLYLGDFDWDNFVVDPSNYRVTIVQTRHIIAVDKNGKFRNRDEMHTVNASVLNEATVAAIANGRCRGNVSETGDAGGPTPPCLSEAHADALCGQPLSDHNYWAVCMSILHGGDSPTQHSGCRDFVADLPPLLRFALERCLADDAAGARMAHVQAALENIGLALGEA